VFPLTNRTAHDRAAVPARDGDWVAIERRHGASKSRLGKITRVAVPSGH
jgi:hypothetical protein